MGIPEVHKAITPRELRQVLRNQGVRCAAVHDLRAAGLSGSSLRWLLCKGYAEHAVETTRPHAARRSFRPAGNLMLCPRSCFVLTPAGVILARGGSPAPRKRGTPQETLPPPAPRAAARPKVPHWDAERRELRWGRTLVKRLLPTALNQELILAAFEEEGWPAHVD